MPNLPFAVVKRKCSRTEGEGARAFPTAESTVPQYYHIIISTVHTELSVNANQVGAPSVGPTTTCPTIIPIIIFFLSNSTVVLHTTYSPHAHVQLGGFQYCSIGGKV